MISKIKAEKAIETLSLYVLHMSENREDDLKKEVYKLKTEISRLKRELSYRQSITKDYVISEKYNSALDQIYQKTNIKLGCFTTIKKEELFTIIKECNLIAHRKEKIFE